MSSDSLQLPCTRTSNFLTVAMVMVVKRRLFGRLYEFRQPPTSLCTTSNFPMVAMVMVVKRRLFSEPKFPETKSDTFFRYQNFQNPNPPEIAKVSRLRPKPRLLNIFDNFWRDTQLKDLLPTFNVDHNINYDALNLYD